MNDYGKKHVNISRQLTFDGWDYYEKVDFEYKRISKSRYLEIRASNQCFTKKLKEERARLRSS